MIVGEKTTSRLPAVLLALIGGLVCASALAADSYGEARADLVAAYQAGDYSAMRGAAIKALEARPGYPGALFNRALAEVLDGDPSASLRTLRHLADVGVEFGADSIEEFEPLKSLPEWSRYLIAVDALREPVGEAIVTHTLDVADFVPEGIAIDKDGALYLGSIRHGSIVHVGDQVRYLSRGEDHWSVFGMRLDGEGALWFASANIPEFKRTGGVDKGGTGIYRLDLASNEVDGVDLPPGDAAQVLGDLILLEADQILTTESLSGALYRYSIPDRSFSEVIAPGTFNSLQGLVLAPDEKHLYFADYNRGLFRLQLATGEIKRISAGDPVSLYGIDGLYIHDNELIAIQNGIRPNRIVALTLSEHGGAVIDTRVLARNLPQFDEPTLGQVVGDDFYFVANSHWNRFDRDGNLPDGLAGPVVMRLSLRR